MNKEDRNKTQTQYEVEGSLEKPGPIGRLIRLGWGMVLAWGFVSLVDNWQHLVSIETLPHWSFLLLVLFIIWRIFPYVITIGFGVNAFYDPLRYGWLALNLIGVGLSWLITGNLWSPVMGWFVGIWLLYTIGHLGISFLLSSALATPGCEMRSIPHLWSKITNQNTQEHFCPGHIDTIDRWEMKLRKNQ